VAFAGEQRQMGRRAFCGRLVTGSVAAGLWLAHPAGAISDELSKAERAPGEHSTVVVARSERLWADEEHVNVAEARRLIDEAVRRLTGAKRPREAWASLFRKDDTVAIKVNTLSGKRLSTRPETTEAIAQSLIEAGVSAEHIIIWDRRGVELERAGFTPDSIGGKASVIGTDQLRGGGYEASVEFAGSIGSCFSMMLSRVATAVINVPVLKDHDLAGVTGGMKNFFGAIHNPNKYHDNHCDPYIADLSAHPYIREKLRLVVCDASMAQANNGPAYFEKWAWRYDGYIVSRDPVAADQIGYEIIDERRRAVGLPTLEEAQRAPLHIASGARLGLGHSDASRIQKMTIS